MNSTDLYLFYCTLASYVLGTLAFLSHLFRPRDQLARLAVSFTVLAFALHTGLLVYRYVALTHFPVINLHNSFLFFTWSLVGVFLVVNAKYKVTVLGSFVTPLAAVLFISSAPILTQQQGPIPPALRSFWLPVHSTLSFIGEAIFGLAFCVGVMYLIQENQIKKKKWNAFFHRLPALKTLDDLNYLCISLGFPLLTMGIITGSIWAASAWGSYWSWDPKETWSLITWLIYAALLHGRLNIGWRGRLAATFSIVGFGVVLFTFLGVNILIPGLHSYESLASPVP